MLKKLAILLALMTFSACDLDQKIPDCPACKFWRADSKTESIRRTQDEMKIQCNSKEFDQYNCISDDGLEAFIETYINGCQDWGEKDLVKMKKVLRRNLDAIRR